MNNKFADLKNVLDQHGVMIAVDVVLTGVIVLLFWSIDCVKVRSALRSKPTLPWPTNQPWRQPVGIRFIETLKEGLIKREKFLTLGRAWAVAFTQRREAALGEGASLLQVSTFVITESFRSGYILSESDYDQGSRCCAQIDRLWKGDAHLEIEDRRERIQQLERNKKMLALAEDTCKIDSVDEQIIAIRRELRDLDALVARAQSSPQEVEYRATKDERMLDMQFAIEEKFRPVLTQMETVKAQDALIKQVQADPGFTKAQKAALIEEINKAAQGTPKEKQPRGAISIYKKDA
ncbi:MAG: hypothetical protein K2X00_17655 [Nitrospiraceae bacterium]|nr:hypothetical protein [Nitrospiraceae bacterium]